MAPHLDSGLVAFTVRRISAAEVAAYLTDRRDIPLQQRPSFAAVKAEWQHLFLGWFTQTGARAGEKMVGSAVVLLRPLPRTRYTLAYIPEGPLLDWDSPDALTALPPLLEVLRAHGAFMVKIGPRLPVRIWRARTMRAALADDQRPARWRDLPPDVTTDRLRLSLALKAAGWQPYEAPTAGFGGTLQPRYGFELNLADHTLAELKAGMSTQWRRNITRAAKRGVEVETPGVDGLTEFHRLLVASGERGGFIPRDEAYFRHMWEVMSAEDPNLISLYLARHDGVAHAGMLMVSSGDRASYTFGGSDEAGRDVRPSNAVQWQMVCDAHAAGRRVFDLRGASDGIASGDPEVGLTTFKAGLGADAVEYLGEWDYVLRPVLGHPFRAYWNRQPH